jgi:hypothetical protein
VTDMLSLLRRSAVSPTPDQTAALVGLAALDYDTAPAVALQQAQNLLESIDGKISALNSSTWGGQANRLRFPPMASLQLDGMIADAGQQAALVLARNRLMDISVRAEHINQQ